MKTVKEFKLEIEPKQSIKVPFNSVILGLAAAGDSPILFILEDSKSDRYLERTFHIAATDGEIEQRLNDSHYIGSYPFHQELVSGWTTTWFHVFEER